MPDWKRYVRSHLPALSVKPERESEIVEELAVQLEQAFKDALAAGADEAEATRIANAQFRDWRALARDIEIAEPVANRTCPKIERLVGAPPTSVTHCA